jgi:hypothetical protein
MREQFGKNRKLCQESRKTGTWIRLVMHTCCRLLVSIPKGTDPLVRKANVGNVFRGSAVSVEKREVMVERTPPGRKSIDLASILSFAGIPSASSHSNIVRVTETQKTRSTSAKGRLKASFGSEQLQKSLEEDSYTPTTRTCIASRSS